MSKFEIILLVVFCLAIMGFSLLNVISESKKMEKLIKEGRKEEASKEIRKGFLYNLLEFISNKF